MSTIQATNLKHNASASNNIVLDSSGNATFAGTAAMSSSFLRNRIINGDMRIDQRNAGASVNVTAGGVFVVDRWDVTEDTDGTMTAQQSSVAPTGFTNSLLVTTTSADASLASSQYVMISQRVEGFNVSDLAWGSASAQPVTLSFWVRSSLTGTFAGSLRNNAADRSYPFTYAIASANTWEQKTITIPGDTAGAWLTSNGIGIRLAFGLGVGSSLSGAAGAWASANLISATGSTSVIGTNGATFYLTGVQLEVGTAATPFERRQFGQELALCQRYFETSGGNYQIFSGYVESGAVFYNSVRFSVTKRATPTISVTSVSNSRFAGTPSAGDIAVGGFNGFSQATSTGTSAWFQYSWTASAEL